MARKHRPYTPQEDAIILAEWGKTPRAELSRRLGRPIGGIRKRRRRLLWGMPIPTPLSGVGAEEVQRRREQYAERMAGCPLERWLENRVDFSAQGNMGSRRGHCRGCRCQQKIREAAFLAESRKAVA